MSAARMTHQVDWLRADLFDECDGVADMLRHPVVAGRDTVPMFGKEMPQAHRDHAMVSRQRSEHGIPGAEVAERAVHADQRMALSDLEIGHVIIVDSNALHASSPPKIPARHRRISAGPARTSDASRSGSSPSSNWAHALPAH